MALSLSAPHIVDEGIQNRSHCDTQTETINQLVLVDRVASELRKTPKPLQQFGFKMSPTAQVLRTLKVV
jgi:hypothetical protein